MLKIILFFIFFFESSVNIYSFNQYSFKNAFEREICDSVKKDKVVIRTSVGNLIINKTSTETKNEIGLNTTQLERSKLNSFKIEFDNLKFDDDLHQESELKKIYEDKVIVQLNSNDSCELVSYKIIKGGTLGKFNDFVLKFCEELVKYDINKDLVILFYECGNSISLPIYYKQMK